MEAKVHDKPKSSLLSVGNISDLETLEGRKVRIAVVGCCHGELEVIYNLISEINRVDESKIDLLICCGDFQATRNEADLACMASPVKYHSMVSFYKYYSGELEAPVPTIFIHGNHEASNYLTELYHGGWVARNIYYLGYAGVVKFAGIRIGGFSGIYNHRYYTTGHFETCPYSPSDMRSVYYQRLYEKFQLSQLREPIDVFLTHDWPSNIVNSGDVTKLLRVKPHFREDIEKGELGSPAHEELLRVLKPKYWFAGHLHVKFPAVVNHSDTPGDITRFVALDKVMPRREFLQVVEIPTRCTDRGPYSIEYDQEWLAVLRNTWDLFSRERSHAIIPTPRSPLPYSPPKLEFVEYENEISDIVEVFKRMHTETSGQRFDHSATPTELDFARKLALLANGGTMVIDENAFTPTAPAYVETGRLDKNASQPTGLAPNWVNPQSVRLCQILGVAPKDHFQVYQPSSDSQKDHRIQNTSRDSLQLGVKRVLESHANLDSIASNAENPDEIDLDNL